MLCPMHCLHSAQLSQSSLVFVCLFVIIAEYIVKLWQALAYRGSPESTTRSWESIQKARGTYWSNALGSSCTEGEVTTTHSSLPSDSPSTQGSHTKRAREKPARWSENFV